MFKSFRQSSSAKFNSSSSSDNKLQQFEGEKQKQKKKLSFKDPEVEKPPEPPGGIAPSHSREKDYYLREPQNLEDFYPEDQEQVLKQQAARSSRDRSRSPDPRNRILDQPKVAKDREAENPFEDVNPKASNRQKLLLPAATKQDYLEVLSPPKPEAAAMKCPVIEFIEEEEENASSSSPVKNLGTNVEPLPTSARHQIQLLNYQLEQQRQQTQTAMYQIQLLKDQLEAESAARYKAQVHNHQLMLKNKQLLDHIQKLFHQVQDLEKKIEVLETDALNHDSRQIHNHQDAHGRAQTSYRRNSGSTQSLWSTPGLLNPTYMASGSRRGSATSLPVQQAEAGESSPAAEQQAENTRKVLLSGKGDSYKYSSPLVDTDWRAKRRGSSGNYNTLDFSRIKSSISDAGSSDRYAGPSSTRSQQIPADSKHLQQQQLSVTYGHRRSESVSGLDRATSRKTIAIDDNLLIGDEDTGNDFSANVSQGANNDRMRSETSSSINCSDQMSREMTSKSRAASSKKTFTSFGLKENHSKLAQSLETLRLFNS